MESSRGDARFFFTTAVRQINAINEYARKKFSNVFTGGKSDRQNTPQASFRYIVGRGVEERNKQLIWLGENDPVKIDGLKRIPIIEYYQILDNKIELANKLKEKNRNA